MESMSNHTPQPQQRGRLNPHQPRDKVAAGRERAFRLVPAAMALLMASVLAACGGGGGSTSGAAASTSLPTGTSTAAGATTATAPGATGTTTTGSTGTTTPPADTTPTPVQAAQSSYGIGLPAGGSSSGTAPLPPGPVGDPATLGQWSAVYNWPQVAINLDLLPDGKILSYADDDDADYHRTGKRGPGFSKAYVTDIQPDSPPGGSIYVPNNTTDLFCSGDAYMPDGRMLVAGGHISDGVGSADASIFDFHDYSWTKVDSMNAGRWYPTATSLPNGEILITGGLIDPTTVNQLPQVWKVNGGWRDLPNASMEYAGYAPMHVAPNGKVFMSTSQTSRYIDTAGNGNLITVAPHKYQRPRDYGSSVVYDDGKILVMGGDGNGTDSTPPTETAEIINLNDANPAWQWTSPMQYKRRQMNATLLADGTVLATGGTSTTGFNDAAQAVLPAELWDPATGKWTTMASMAVPRLYHSTALLLPDGRVLSAGGGRPAPDNGTDNSNVEFYSPPYLFRGARPHLITAPVSVNFGDTFSVQTTDAADIAKVTWVRLGVVTHAFNMNQRINVLPFTVGKSTLNITAPSNRNLTPPGHYMLFLINSKGVPSIAKIVQII
jgi:hypothetical protein